MRSPTISLLRCLAKLSTAAAAGAGAAAEVATARVRFRSTPCVFGCVWLARFIQLPEKRKTRMHMYGRLSAICQAYCATGAALTGTDTGPDRLADRRTVCLALPHEFANFAQTVCKQWTLFQTQIKPRQGQRVRQIRTARECALCGGLPLSVRVCMCASVCGIWRPHFKFMLKSLEANQ